jgi:hypothetical protein
VRKAMLGLALLAALACGGCACTAERNAVSNIERTHELVLPAYLEYVGKDAALTPAQRDDRKKLVESLRRLVAELRRRPRPS